MITIKIYIAQDTIEQGYYIVIDDEDNLYDWNLSEDNHVASILEIDPKEYIEMLVNKYHAFKIMGIIKLGNLIESSYCKVLFKNKEDAQNAINEYIQPIALIKVLSIKSKL